MKRPDNPYDAMRRVINHEANQDDDGGFFAKLGGLEPDSEDGGPTAKGLFQHIDLAPEDHAEWEECTWSDILPTDERVKAEYISGTVIEGVPDGISDNGVYLVDGKLIPYSTDARWYHIPSMGPNPAEYPVILVSAGHGVEYNQPEPHVWDGEAYSAVDRSLSYLMPSQITEWEPAKIVPQKE